MFGVMFMKKKKEFPAVGLIIFNSFASIEDLKLFRAAF